MLRRHTCRPHFTTTSFNVHTLFTFLFARSFFNFSGPLSSMSLRHAVLMASRSRGRNGFRAILRISFTFAQIINHWILEVNRDGATHIATGQLPGDPGHEGGHQVEGGGLLGSLAEPRELGEAGGATRAAGTARVLAHAARRHGRVLPVRQPAGLAYAALQENINFWSEMYLYFCSHLRHPG